MKRVCVEINKKEVGFCSGVTFEKNPLLQPTIEPLLSIEGFVKLNPDLNNNQLMVLNWLKNKYNDRSINGWSVFDVLGSLAMNYETLGETINEPDFLKAYGVLEHEQQFQVLEVFVGWGLEK